MITGGRRKVALGRWVLGAAGPEPSRLRSVMGRSLPGLREQSDVAIDLLVNGNSGNEDSK